MKNLWETSWWLASKLVDRVWLNIASKISASKVGKKLGNKDTKEYREIGIFSYCKTDTSLQNLHVIVIIIFSYIP